MEMTKRSYLQVTVDEDLEDLIDPNKKLVTFLNSDNEDLQIIIDRSYLSDSKMGVTVLADMKSVSLVCLPGESLNGTRRVIVLNTQLSHE